jgi:oxygen-independent coproporphyrinogen III oxidase
MYCDFFSVTDRSSTDAFVDACVMEIQARAAELDGAAEFTSVFFGGGTPSLLEERQMEKIMNALHASFRISGTAECTMEANPGTLTQDKLFAFRQLGLNRLSIGVQSFFDDDLRALDRIHTADDARIAVTAAQQAGFRNISVDLLQSIPGQTAERLRANLAQALALGVRHLSCYSLTVEAATPLDTLVRSGAIAMPPVETDAALYRLTMEILEAAGFRHYEVSNYAAPGYESLHNLSYWRLEDYLGFGPSAYSTWDGVRLRNVKDVSAYVDELKNGRIPVQELERLTLSQRREEYIFLRLRSEGIDEEEFRARFGADFTEENNAVVQQSIKDGLLRKNGATLTLTPDGFLLCDELCARLK